MDLMRLLMVGDVVGRPGRRIVQAWLARLKRERKIDFVIINGENAAGGSGITAEICAAMLDAGADVVTLGNHAWAKREVYDYLDSEPRVLRPANYPPGAPGRGAGQFPSPIGPIGVASLQGRTFMEPVDDPFRAADQLVREQLAGCAASVIDFHAEATSEKQALAWHLDGRVTALIGTHTHVQTADERILERGTAYLTDVGMTGPRNSVIGVEPERVVSKFRTMLPIKFEVADGPAQLNALQMDVHAQTGRAIRLERIQVYEEDGDSL